MRCDMKAIPLGGPRMGNLFGRHLVYYPNQFPTCRIMRDRNFSGDPVDKIVLPMQGAQLQSLVGKLKSHTVQPNNNNNNNGECIL